MVAGRLHGIARYALELAQRLPALEPAWRFVGLTGPQGLPDDLEALAPAIDTFKCGLPFLHPVEQPALAASLLAIRPDLFHATSFSLPALWPGRFVGTLHDAIHLARPAEHGVQQRLYYAWVVRPAARRARALLTVSEFSRGELAHHLKIAPERFQVVPEGVAAHFRPPRVSELAAFRARHGLPARWFAVVGNAKPFKNLTFAAQVARQLPAPVALLAGAGAARRFAFPESTVELSALSEEELPLFYGGAAALLLPSLHEGFGLPALEAMACACPVVALRAGALPETVGEAGVLLDGDATAWRDALARLYRDEGHRRELTERGLARAARFGWDECARRTLAVYRRAL
jgi:glycosyltransferase involved in cell wall biosynthesis